MECQVCMVPFNDSERRPKVLPCGHSYCLCCLKQLRSRRCPVDSKVFEAAPDDLLDNFIVLEATNTPAETAAPRFWCLSCKRDATDRCVEEHTVCSIKKARSLDAAPLLESLQRGEAAVDELCDTLDDVERELRDFRVELEEEKAGLVSARERLQDALTAGAHGEAWQQVKQAAVLRGLSRTAARLVADLADGAACSVQLRRGAGGGVAWRGEVLPAEDSASRLLLCRLACSGGLRQEGQVYDSATPLPATDSRRRERSSGEDLLTVEEMAKWMEVGSRVARGRDWLPTCTVDGSPPGPGTVTRKCNSSVDVKWDRTGATHTHSMGYKGTYRLRLLPPEPKDSSSQ